jgi:chromosomal replication initiator protein
MSTVLAHMQTMHGGPDFAEEPRVQVEAPPRSLDSRYTFEKFVVGPTNQFAHAAPAWWPRRPASKWNPLFIYGGVGLGKTHLLHAVGREIWRQHPEWKIVCITCERFVTEFIGAIRDNSGKRSSGSSPDGAVPAQATGKSRTSC